MLSLRRYCSILWSTKSAIHRSLREVFQTPLFSFQRGLARLEKGGVIVSHRKGKTLLYQFNPRYPFLKELKSFLERAYDGFPQDIRDKYYEQMTRKRPRRQGKPL